MPFGLWKSKWEIHREDMARRAAESERRSEEHRAEMDRERIKTDELFAEARAERARSDERWEEFKRQWAESNERWDKIEEESRTSRERFEAELVATRRSNEELTAKVEGSTDRIEAACTIIVQETRGMRGDMHEMRRDINDMKDSVDAQTQGVFRLIDRVDGWEERPPPRAV
jgi:septal ring factor EnvC (AmiA/AmiB activator)